jgi:hypothetical protein
MKTESSARCCVTAATTIEHKLRKQNKRDLNDCQHRWVKFEGRREPFGALIARVRALVLARSLPRATKLKKPATIVVNITHRIIRNKPPERDITVEDLLCRVGGAKI